MVESLRGQCTGSSLSMSPPLSQVLLGMSAFEGLSSAQKHQLTALLPTVDQAINGR